MAGSVPVLLITANVGSIFEEPSVMLKIWTEEFLSTISRLDPKFIALHCQEVGGKNYEQSMRHVEYFVRLLMSSEELRLFDRVRVFLDEDYSSAEHFTALGNFYFVHESLKDVLLWDFKDSSFIPANGKEVHSGNIEAVTTKEKAKFPQDFFPECKWSRKGFLRTRWSISGSVFDLINIHLFHDASNFVAMETFPSVYSKTRRRALEHTLDRFHNDQYPNVPYFLFGDFNFRTDTAGVIKKLTEDTQESKLPSKGGISRLQFHSKDDSLILTLGKKEFSYYEHQDVFNENSGQWLHEFDKELDDFNGRLFEFPITFLPSYPFEEDIKEGKNYMKTRVPAWCDRVLLSPTAKMLVQNISVPKAVEYGIIGPLTCMGDHKPVYLRAVLDSDAGTVNCCHLANAPQFCFRVPDSYVDSLSVLPNYRSGASAQTAMDRSANFLHAVPFKHDPYTPDSMDSPSPNAIVVLGEVPDVDLDNPDTTTDPASTVHTTRTWSAPKRIDRAVSPSLLKSKLELIVQSEKKEILESEFDNTDIRRSPSECHLHSRVDANENVKGLRKNRSNNDVSWQRSHLLTHAWLQDSGQKVYQSFHSNFAHESSSSVSPTETTGGLTSDLIIPRIAIINASNFESNESSVHQHDDRLSMYSDNRLSAYSDNRTKTVSGEGSSLEKSDEIYGKIEEESEKVSSNTEDDLEMIEDTSLREPEKHIPSERMCSNRSHEKSLLEDVIIRDNQKNLRNLGREMTGASLKEQNVLRRVIETRSLSAEIEDQNISKDVNKISKTIENPVEDTVKSSINRESDRIEKYMMQQTEIIEADMQATEGYRSVNGEMEEVLPILSSSLSHSPMQYKGNTEAVFVEEKIGKYNVAYDARIAASTKPKNLEKGDSEVSVIDETRNTYIPNMSANEIEVLSTDSRQDMPASKNTTRSNSTHSQDNADRKTGKIRLHLKACKVTEKCKTDIVSRSRCHKCCCVIS